MSTEQQTYAHGGLRFRSDVALPFPISRQQSWDLEVHQGDDIQTSSPPTGEVIAEYSLNGAWWYVLADTGADYRLRFRDCGEFTVSRDVTQIEIRRDPAGRHELLPILLAGTVTAALLTMRGRTVLHASAVSFHDSATAFMGQSGQGKSTLAALMCSRGARLVADDVLTVDSGPTVRCTGGATELRLRSSSAQIAETIPAATTRTTADHRLAVRTESARTEPIPLARIIVPRPSRTATETQVRLLTASEGLVAMLSSPRVLGWRSPDVVARDFDVLGEIANRVPIFDVTIPWGPPFRADVAKDVAVLAGASPGETA
jgi:hypothetical protein